MSIFWLYRLYTFVLVWLIQMALNRNEGLDHLPPALWPLYYSRLQWRKKVFISIWGERGGGCKPWYRPVYGGGGMRRGTMHFKVMRERMGWGGAGPFCYPPPPFLRLWNQNLARHGMHILTGKVGIFFVCFIGHRSSTIWEASYLLTGRRWRIVSCWTGSF